MIPDELFEKIRRLEVRTRGLVDSLFGGEYHSAFKGKGIEFAEVRPYQIGDDVRSIDWNVSARMPETYVKLFEEEREQNLLLLVDVSASEQFGSRQLKRDLAAEAAALLAFSASQNQDNVGLLLYSDQNELFVRPSRGRRHVLRLIRELYTCEPEGSGTDLASGFRLALRLLRRRAIVLVLSDFIDEGYDNELRALARRHDTIALHLQDEREEELPNVGIIELRDAETGEKRLVDTADPAVRRSFAEAAYRRRKETAQLFKKLQVDHVPLRTGEDYSLTLARFFRERNRR